MTESKRITEQDLSIIADSIIETATEKAIDAFMPALKTEMRPVIIECIKDEMTRRKAEQANGKEITWYGKRGQVETVTYPAKTEPEAVPAAADRNQENGENGQG